MSRCLRVDDRLAVALVLVRQVGERRGRCAGHTRGELALTREERGDSLGSSTWKRWVEICPSRCSIGLAAESRRGSGVATADTAASGAEDSPSARSSSNAVALSSRSSASSPNYHALKRLCSGAFAFCHANINPDCIS